ncbi:hypothetical protein ACFL6D_03365 [Spirochaetota bacterium]
MARNIFYKLVLIFAACLIVCTSLFAAKKKKKSLISDFKVASEAEYELTRLEEKSTVYIDRDYIFTSIPESLIGKRFIMTANNDRDFTDEEVLVSFIVNANVTILLGVDSRLESLPEWMEEEWTDAKLTLGTSDGECDLNLYKKSFKKGEEVALGCIKAEGAQGINSNYAILLIIDKGKKKK